MEVEKSGETDKSEETDKSGETDKKEKEKEKKYEGPRQNYTRFCNLGKECKRGTRCIWAHTLKQLNPIICKWDLSEEGCLRFAKCFFKHKGETLIQYVKRAFPEDLAKLNIFVNEIDHVSKTVQKEKEKEEYDDEEIEQWKQEYLKLLKAYQKKFYDPAFEIYTWGEINDFQSELDMH